MKKAGVLTIFVNRSNFGWIEATVRPARQYLIIDMKSLQKVKCLHLRITETYNFIKTFQFPVFRKKYKIYTGGNTATVKLFKGHHSYKCT